MGLRGAVHWVGWFVTALVQALLTMTALAIILSLGDILHYTNGFLLWLTLLVFGLNAILFACVLLAKNHTAAGVPSLCMLSESATHTHTHRHTRTRSCFQNVSLAHESGKGADRLVVRFRFLVSTFFDDSKIGAACAGIFYMLTYVPYMIVSILENAGYPQEAWIKILTVRQAQDVSLNIAMP